MRTRHYQCLFSDLKVAKKMSVLAEVQARQLEI